jgi:phosphatidylinositol alpha-mannosyltransferase
MVIPSIRAFLQEREFDVIHLHEPYLPFIGPTFLYLGRAVKVGTFHTWRQGPHVPYLLSRPLIRHWNRKLDGRIAVSIPARNTVHRYVPAEYRIIPNGVHFERFSCPLPPPAHLADERPTLLFVGRIEARKGIPYLLKAYGIVKRRVPESRLVIVGEGRLKGEYQRLAATMGLRDVLFEGFASPDDLPRYYQRADVFCSSSTVNEAFGITLLEAMSAGTPTVATTTNSATLGEHEVHGLMVPPKDEAAMADATIRMLKDRQMARRLAAAARERAREYDWTRVAQQLLDYYQELGA